MQTNSECEVSEDCTFCGPEEVWHELSFLNMRRRASLEEARPLKEVSNERCGRRSSFGNVNASSQFCSRRSSLGEEVLRLNFLRRNFSNSFTSLAESSRRPSLDSDGSSYEPRRRSSLGAESLIESDVEDEQDGYKQGEPPPEAVLGLQYVDDVFAVKRDLELRYHPRNCLNAQPQVSAPVRCTLVNWLVKVNRQLQFGSETVFLAVNLLDRFLACSAIASDCAQLLAVCSLFVAAKMEESKVPGIGGLSVLCSSSYQRHHFRRMEILLLTKLGFALHAPSSWYFINYLALKACQLGYLDRNVCRFARRVAETCLCRYDIAQFLPSIQAAAALVYAATAINPDESSRIQPALLQDGVWAQQCRDTLHAEERCHSSPEEMVQQAFESSLEGVDYSAQFQSTSRIEDPLEDFSLLDNAYYASSLQQSVFDDIMHHKESNFETSSAAIMELINVLVILFSFHERCEIVHCSDLMKNHLASYDEQRASRAPIVDPHVGAVELHTATNHSKPSIIAQTLLCGSSGCNNFETTAGTATKYFSSSSGISQIALPASSVVEIVHVAHEEQNISTKRATTMTTVSLSVSSSSCRLGPRFVPVSGIIARMRQTTSDFDYSANPSLQCFDHINWSQDLAEFNQSRRDSGISTIDFEFNVGGNFSSSSAAPPRASVDN